MSSDGYRSSDARLETKSIAVELGGSALAAHLGPDQRRRDQAEVTYNNLALCAGKIVEMD
jgi:hypothetical protein